MRSQGSAHSKAVEPSLLRAMALFGSAIALTFFTISGRHGLLQLIQIYDNADALAQNNRRLESEIVATRQAIDELWHNDYILEKRAREDLGLARPTDSVYIFARHRR